MADHRSIKEMVWSSFEDLHAEHPDRAGFSRREVEHGAWIYHPQFDRRSKAINGLRRVIGMSPKEQLKPPHWFRMPGVSRAFSDLLGDGYIIEEFTGPEGVITDKIAYLNPPRIDGERPPARSLSSEDARYRLAHIAIEEIALAA